MTPNRLVTLIILAILTIGVGTWLANRQAATPPPANAAVLYPELKKELDTISAVRLFKAGDARSVELLKGKRGWTVTEREGYAADQAKIAKLLRSLADAKPLEEKTSNPESYSSLGVEDTKDAKASGLRIELTGTSKPVNLIVGKRGGGAQSTYVRRAGEPASWLVSASIDSSSTPDAWLRKDIVDVSAARIQSATVTTGSAKPYVAAKATRADANFAVTGLPKGKELASASAANSTATALVGLALADVRTRKEFESAPVSARAVFNTFDGLVAAIDGWQKDDKHFVALTVSYDAALAERFRVATAPAEAKPDAAAAPPPARPETKAGVEDEAKSAIARLAGWVYEIPQYKYEAIFKPVDELTKK
jgi:hypothetical protein